MMKCIQLKLSEVKYVGESIGDDIRIEVQALNLFWGLNKQIKNGTTITLNKEVGQLFVDQSTFSLPLNIKVIEQDFIFDDVGSLDIKIKVDLHMSTPQVSMHEIRVQEHRSLSPGRLTAKFLVTLEVVVVPALRYITLDTPDGWLKIKRINSTETMSLPAYLKVRFDSTDSKREYFTILEGPWQGVQASVTLDLQGKSYLLETNEQTEFVSMTYSISKKILTLGRETYFATDDTSNPWRKGLYDIEIPDAPHRGGVYYPETKYGKTWFRVGHSGDRYIHTGRHSLGCITLTEQKRWDVLCHKLMKARKNDGKSIGTLQIID